MAEPERGRISRTLWKLTMHLTIFDLHPFQFSVIQIWCSIFIKWPEPERSEEEHILHHSPFCNNFSHHEFVEHFFDIYENYWIQNFNYMYNLVGAFSAFSLCVNRVHETHCAMMNVKVLRKWNRCTILLIWKLKMLIPNSNSTWPNHCAAVRISVRSNVYDLGNAVTLCSTGECLLIRQSVSK